MSNYVTMNGDITMPIIILTGFVSLFIACGISCFYIWDYFHKRSNIFKQKSE